MGSHEREQFDADELAIVLSHYDLGTIESIQEFARGSRRAPKLIVKTANNSYLLKRRAAGKDHPFKVAFCHALQLHLADKQFPLPHLIGTRKDNNSMLQWREAIYELFEFIRGEDYDQSLEATFDAGKTLGLYHSLLADYQPAWEPPTGSYHSAAGVKNSLTALAMNLARDGAMSSRRDDVNQTVDSLAGAYHNAGEQVVRSGYDNWATQIVHSDWHPGNMLFWNGRVVAVIDYDAARLLPRITDVANGALQFSIIGGGDDASKWPAYLDETRLKRFLRGYDQVNVLSKAELEVLPMLMIEALIAEAALPIAATGSFGRMDGYAFLSMVDRKVKWIQNSAEQLTRVLPE